MSTRSIVPRADGEGGIGSSLKRWLSGFFKWLDISEYIGFTPNSASYKEGRIFYDSINKTLTLYNDNSQVTHQLGQEHLARVYNNSGVDIEDGKVIKVNGSNGIGCPSVEMTKADTEDNASVFGMTTTSIANGAYGYSCLCGAIHNLNTSMFSDGDLVYLSDSILGGITNVKPGIVTIVGRIIKADATQGIIYVFPKELGQISADMLKSVYDTDDNGIVDKSETVDDGLGNSSSAADVKDAISKKHTQNTDQKLDEGGANEVSASDVVKKSGSLTQITTRNHSDLQNKNSETDIKHVTDNQKNGLDNANSPSTLNPLVTKEDVKYYYAESLGETSTTSNYPTYINKLTLNIPTPIAGDYILEWNYEIINSGSGNDTWKRIRNDSITFHEARLNPGITYANTGWIEYSGFIKVTLTGSAVNFYIDFCRHTAGTAYIKNAKLLLRRIV